jgi:NAD(P)-dependent dehydrogenase (short-subunit alcohol dehydrogenase family)
MTDSLFNISGKVALVTGASSGIGAHFCKVLANAGAKVVACARSKDKLDAVVADIRATGGEAEALVMDVTSRTSIVKAFDEAEQKLGTPEIICNNAGVAVVKPFDKLEEKDWDFVINTDLKSVFNVGQEAAQRLIKAKKAGSIINTASILGLAVSPGQCAYSSAKAGVIQLTRNMALDLLRHNIRVNALCPGYFKTEMNRDFFDSTEGEQYIKSFPSRRIGKLEELDGVLMLLASDASSYMSGTSIPIDACHSIRLI